MTCENTYQISHRNMDMALREEMESQGQSLFRWRSYLPFVLLSLVLAGFTELAVSGHSHLKSTGYSYELELFFELTCLMVSLSGLGIRIVTTGYAAPGTSGRNTHRQRADSLNTTGMYSVTRNPLYLGNFLNGLGFSLFCGVWWVPTLYVAAFWLYYERIIYREEEYLRSKFGEEFLNWASRTPAFFPAFRYPVSPERRFNVRRVIRNEYSTLFLIISIFTLFDGLENLFVEGAFRVDRIWIGLFAAAACVWLLVKTMKKRTRFFSQQESECPQASASSESTPGHRAEIDTGAPRTIDMEPPAPLLSAGTV